MIGYTNGNRVAASKYLGSAIERVRAGDHRQRARPPARRELPFGCRETVRTLRPARGRPQSTEGLTSQRRLSIQTAAGRRRVSRIDSEAVKRVGRIGDDEAVAKESAA